MFSIFDNVDVNAVLERASEPMWKMSPAHHEAAVSVAVERAKQEMFEACVKAICPYCRGWHTDEVESSPVLVKGTPMHPYIYGAPVLCGADSIRLAFPDLSAAMNARVGSR